jgi:hypothetical protein
MCCQPSGAICARRSSNDGADMARLYNISAPTVSRIAAHRTGFI